MIVKCMRKDGNFDDIAVLESADSLPIHETKVHRKRQGKKSHEYLDIFGTFDIETTSRTGMVDGKETPIDAFMYVWSACIDGTEIVGRTWDGVKQLFTVLKNRYKLSYDKRYMVIYVHNLSFEFSFMAGFFHDYADIFATGERKPLAWRLQEYGIELRCSYKLTNMSLDNFVKKTPNVTHCKAVGDLDYSLCRTTETEITDTEWTYICGDTLCQWEAIKAKMELDGDIIATIPLTSTSYVRRDMKRSCNQTRYFRDLKKRIALTDESYTLCKEAFRGGDTHANAEYAGRILHGVYSYDASSMYPAQQLLFKFPMTPFEPYSVSDTTLSEIHGRPWVARVRFTDLYLRDGQHNPYLSISKCRNGKGIDNDNGRVYACESLETTITDIDYEIILECYENSENIEFMQGTLFVSSYDYLPKCVTDVIMEYFRSKTELKIAVKKAATLEEAEARTYDLMKSKNKLNGIYGMSATDPVHEEICYNGEEWRIGENMEKSIEDLCAENTLPYQWGVWTTALARKHLRRMLAVAGDGYVYCDTDSVKCISFDREKLNELNSWIYRLCDDRGVTLEIGGKKTYIGYFDNESHLGDTFTYKDFITLGAKKYAYNEYFHSVWDTFFEVTISGVQKSKGVKYLKNINGFRIGAYIPDAGGNTAYYLDSNDITTKTVTDYTGKQGKIEYAGYVCLTGREYTIGITDEQMEKYKIYEYVD